MKEKLTFDDKWQIVFWSLMALLMLGALVRMVRGPEPEIVRRDGKLYFHGMRCFDDCSGHRAGYQWAIDHGIDDDEKCGRSSVSFWQGCQLAASEILDQEERQAEDPRPGR